MLAAGSRLMSFVSPTAHDVFPAKGAQAGAESRGLSAQTQLTGAKYCQQEAISS